MRETRPTNAGDEEAPTARPELATRHHPPFVAVVPVPHVSGHHLDFFLPDFFGAFGVSVIVTIRSYFSR